MKKALSIDQQITLLQNRNIEINDISKAKEILLDIGYFRLGFYSFPFEVSYPQRKQRSHEHKKGTNFNDIIALYYFDYNLRNILLKYITRIEINFRTAIIYRISMHYPKTNTWFIEKEIMNKSFVERFNEKIYTPEFKSKNSVLKYHHIKYPKDTFAPAWKTLEFMTLGQIVMLYSNLKNERLQQEIALSGYNIKSSKVLMNYIDTIRKVRNTCAHGGVLFDWKSPQGIKSGPALKINDTNRHNIGSVIKVIVYILSQVSKKRATDMENEIQELLVKNKEENNKVYQIIIKNLECYLAY